MLPVADRRFATPTATVLCCLAVAGGAFASSTEPTPSCSVPGSGWCVARRITGTDAQGGLGFRSGGPLDVDGDGKADIAAGARLKVQQGTLQNGTAAVWSGATGALIRAWDGEWPEGLFGHWVMPVPDLSGDGLADVIIAAPHALSSRGILVARSPKTGEQLWKREETQSGKLGWDLALAGDHDGDGRVDVFAGAPMEQSGFVYLLSGKDGSLLRTFTPQEEGGSFGWYVAQVDDLDGDGRGDLAVGAPTAADPNGVRLGGAWVFSSASGKTLFHWAGSGPHAGFGEVVAALGDLDGDGKGEVAVALAGTEDQSRSLTGEVHVYSGATGKELRHWSGTQPGELYGRMVDDAGDLDGDGVEDVAIGAPWFRRETDDRVGRVEIRSGRSGAVLSELFGDEAGGWFGWHIRRAPDPEGHGRPALLISSTYHSVDGKRNVGLLDLLVLRAAKVGDAQGTTTRDARRSDIK